MIEYGVRTRLLAVTAVTDIVSQRVTVMHLPQNPKLPAITLQVISGAPEYQMEGAAGVANARIQIDCWVHTKNARDPYAKLRTLAEAVRSALGGFTGTSGSSDIQSSFLTSRSVTYDDDAEIYRERQDWMIGYAES